MAGEGYVVISMIDDETGSTIVNHERKTDIGLKDNHHIRDQEIAAPLKRL